MVAPSNHGIKRDASRTNLTPFKIIVLKKKKKKEKKKGGA